MNKIEPDDNDVLSMSKHSMISTDTFKFSQFIKWFTSVFSSSSMPHWLGEGAECELLQPGSPNGWVKGKIRIRFEFIPDKPEEAIADAPGSLVKPE